MSSKSLKHNKAICRADGFYNDFFNPFCFFKFNQIGLRLEATQYKT